MGWQRAGMAGVQPRSPQSATPTALCLPCTLQADPSYTYSERMTWRKLWRLFTIRTNVLVIGQGLFGCLPWGMLLTFLNDFLSQDKGLKVQTATAVRRNSACC